MHHEPNLYVPGYLGAFQPSTAASVIILRTGEDLWARGQGGRTGKRAQAAGPPALPAAFIKKCWRFGDMTSEGLLLKMTRLTVELPVPKCEWGLGGFLLRSEHRGKETLTFSLLFRLGSVLRGFKC